MRNADGSTHRVNRWCFAVGKENPRPFDPARRFRPRPREPRQLRYILLCEPQLDHSTSSRHDPIRLVQQITEQEYKCRVVPTESLAYERFQGIALLVMVMVVVMHVVVIHVVMVGMPGVMRFGRDRRESNRPSKRQRGDDSL